MTMQTRRLTLLAIAAVLAAWAVSLAACSASESDKAGGAEATEPRVLRLANPNDGPPPAQISIWADKVSRLSGGKLAIEFENSWRPGEPQYEAGTLEDVEAGEVDLAWVGSRVFETVGVKSFQALHAPLLVDSYELEGRVFEDGIPEEMLAGVEELDLVGIGVLPGPLRKVLGVSKPFLRPADFEGQVVGMQDSAVAGESLRALGATPRAVPSGADLNGLDAYEQQLGSIAGNSYEAVADSVTTNLNLWPRPLVIVMGKGAFDSLTEEQRSALREAAAAAMPDALAASRAEDDEGASVLCRRGLTFAVASESDLSELRQAFEPVYADLDADAETKSHIDGIAALKTEIAASAQAAVCDSKEEKPTSAAFPEGTYESTITEADWQGVADNPGTFRMEFDSGNVTVYDPPNGEVGFTGTYTVFRDQFEMTGPEDTVSARWSVDGDALTFTDIVVCTQPSCEPSRETRPYVIVMGSHPWVRVQPKSSPIDGVYEFTTTAEELFAIGPDDDLVENYGRFRWVLDRGRFEMTQKNGASDRWTKGSYTVRGDTVVIAVEDYGGVAPNGAHEKTGEVFTYTWSLYRDRLTLGPVEGAISPENFRVKPWTRVD
jgi:TRAP-type C4-dicarboxylate transport system substrate-binding protein